jgi:hypothetical protein
MVMSNIVELFLHADRTVSHLQDPHWRQRFKTYLPSRKPTDEKSLFECVQSLIPFTPLFDMKNKDLDRVIASYYQKSFAVFPDPQNESQLLQKQYLSSCLYLLDLQKIQTFESQQLIQHYLKFLLRHHKTNLQPIYHRADICFLRICHLLHFMDHFHKNHADNAIKTVIARCFFSELSMMEKMLSRSVHFSFLRDYCVILRHVIQNQGKPLADVSALPFDVQKLFANIMAALRGNHRHNLIIKPFFYHIVNLLGLYAEKLLKTPSVKKQIMAVRQMIESMHHTYYKDFYITKDVYLLPFAKKALDDLPGQNQNAQAISQNTKYFPSKQSQLLLIQALDDPKPLKQQQAATAPSLLSVHEKDNAIRGYSRDHAADLPWNLSMHFHGHAILSDQKNLPQGLLLNNSRPKKAHLVHLHEKQVDGHHYIESAHNGYVYDYGIIHERKLFLSRDGDDLRGEDLLKKQDIKLPHLDVPFQLIFCLPQTIHILILQSRSSAILKLPDGSGWQLNISYGQLTQDIDSPFLLDLSDHHKQQQLCISGQTNGSFAHIRWSFKKIK